MKRSLLLALACAAIGFVTVVVVLPRSGGQTTGGWGGEFLGLSGMTLGAMGAAAGLAIGLALTLRRRRPPADMATETGAPPVESTGPSAQVRAWLRKKRRRDAPKRFGKRGR